jgi:two-component system, chemotaxis family, protein-glutamate methylesterase/glutaminase
LIKVLVVDDSALVRKLFGRVLERERDVEVEFARNGVEALEKLHTFEPTVITLDVHMPQMGGLECLDRIMLEKPRPVVMVSARTADGADETLEALRLGAVDFVLKPAGAVSLRIDEFAPTLLQKIRAAATAKLKISTRLRERVLHRTRGPHGQHLAAEKRASRLGRKLRASGDGLVLVGTSTGGPPALEALLVPLPANFPWPILVAQHMPATFTGPLAQRLDGLCALAVTEVLRPTALEPGRVYIGRGDADLIVTQRAAGLTAISAPAEVAYPWHPSTNRLVKSALSCVAPQQLIGVLMTGMGDDGAEAMAQLWQLGGTTIAESEQSAVVWGMPGELVRAGAADWIEPVNKIAARLLQLTPKNASRS